MARNRDTSPNAPVIVLGLGRFGTAVARSLVQLGHDVLAVDERADIVQKYASDFTHVVAADTTDIEASVLTVLGLLDLGVSEVWAKAISGKHAAILERVGATHVIRPESQMGKRVAHLVTGTMTDFIEFDDGFAIARTKAPLCSADQTLERSGIRQKFGVTIVGVKTRGEDFTYAKPETFVSASDELIVSGPTAKVEAFCAQS